MKNRLFISIISISILLSCCLTVYADPSPTIYVNGETIQTDSMIIDGVTYVPLRAISEGLGAQVAWNESTYEINITQGDIYTNAINTISPSVVSIVGNYNPGTTATYQDKYAEGIAHGTGVIITSGGEILTNAHVVKDLTSIIVILSDGQGYEARLKYIDEALDLAVIKIDKLGLVAAKFADELSVFPGNRVLAVGTPVSLGMRNSVAAGIISGVNRSTSSEYTLIQTDAAINPGNSGGPLVNLKGEVVGINSSGYVSLSIEGMNFAIPVSDVKYAINQFNTYGKIKRPGFDSDLEETWTAKIGLPVTGGVTFKNVVPGGAAANAGIQSGDALIAVNGVNINTIPDWNELSKNYLPGSSAVLSILRNDAVIDVNITFSEKN